MTLLEHLQKTKKLYFFRSAAGQVQTMQGRFFRTGKPGCPDISVIYKGKYYGLELKSKTGRQSALQAKAQAQIEAAGGEYHIIKELYDAKRLFIEGLPD